MSRSVGENATFDLHDLDNCCRAAEVHGLGSVFKVDYDIRRFLAQRAIGAGFEGVLFTDGHSVEDARESVRICRPETPADAGVFGAVSRRFSYPEYGGSADYIAAVRQTVVLLMVEKTQMVDELDQVLAVPGLDMIQWGGSDYSMSDGRPGASKSEQTKAVERRVIETSVKAGVPPRVELGSTDEMPYYASLGVRHFSIGVDTRLLYDAWKANAEKVRKFQTGL